MTDLHKINLRLPLDLHALAVELASYQQVSVNAVVIAALRNYLPYEANRLRRAHALPVPPVVVSKGPAVARVGANQPCPCGSGKKYKHCHGRAGAV